MSDELIEKIKAANNLVDKAVLVLNRWCGKDRGSYFMAEHPWQCQDTFAGFIYDNWEEAYEKNLAKPNIRQKVENEIKMIKSRRERKI